MTLETDMKDLKAECDSKNTHLESDLAAKETHIKQLVFCIDVAFGMRSKILIENMHLYY